MCSTQGDHCNGNIKRNFCSTYSDAFFVASFICVSTDYLVRTKGLTGRNEMIFGTKIKQGINTFITFQSLSRLIFSLKLNWTCDFITLAANSSIMLRSLWTTNMKRLKAWIVLLTMLKSKMRLKIIKTLSHAFLTSLNAGFLRSMAKLTTLQAFFDSHCLSPHFRALYKQLG